MNQPPEQNQGLHFAIKVIQRATAAERSLAAAQPEECTALIEENRMLKSVLDSIRRASENARC